MANPFLTSTTKDTETAILYGNAKITDIGNSVAYTDGERVFINTGENLAKILPAYNQDMLKWLLWHERYHMELKHHARYNKFLHEKYKGKSSPLTHDEVNIIMDILVHDSLSKMFPELVPTAITNLAQMRDRNSLRHTFETFNLEDMLKEFADTKTDDKSKEPPSGGTPTDEPSGGGTPVDEPTSGGGTPGKDPTSETPTDEPTGKPASEHTPYDKDKDHGTPSSEPTNKPSGHHDETDWSKLENIDTKEFISKHEATSIEHAMNKLKRKMIRIGNITKKLNALATTTKERTYRIPSLIQMRDGCILKGKTKGKTELYLVFDASGSMNSDMQMFKDIITRSIPQAMQCPCEWFAGYQHTEHPGDKKIEPYKTVDFNGYYKGTFKDFLNIIASDGYSDDGDKTIELCFLAEQKGYSPIGVTDGGGSLKWSKDMLKQLKRTVLVGDEGYWLEACKEVNPHIQTICTDADYVEKGGEV